MAAAQSGPSLPYYHPFMRTPPLEGMARPVTTSISAVVQNPPDGGARDIFTQGVEFFGQGLLLDNDMWRKIGLTVIGLLAVGLARRVLQRVVLRTVDDRNLQYRWGKTIGYVTWVVAVLFVASIWVDGLRQMGTFLGLFTAGLAIALKDVIVDLAGWVVIVTKPPLAIGDRVQIGEHAGDVVDISVLHFTLLEIGNWVEADQSTGRIVRIPNA